MKKKERVNKVCQLSSNVFSVDLKCVTPSNFKRKDRFLFFIVEQYLGWAGKQMIAKAETVMLKFPRHMIYLEP